MARGANLEYGSIVRIGLPTRHASAWKRWHILTEFAFHCSHGTGPTGGTALVRSACPFGRVCKWTLNGPSGLSNGALRPKRRCIPGLGGGLQPPAHYDIVPGDDPNQLVAL